MIKVHFGHSHSCSSLRDHLHPITHVYRMNAYVRAVAGSTTASSNAAGRGRTPGRGSGGLWISPRPRPSPSSAHTTSSATLGFCHRQLGILLPLKKAPVEEPPPHPRPHRPSLRIQPRRRSRRPQPRRPNPPTQLHLRYVRTCSSSPAAYFLVALKALTALRIICRRRKNYRGILLRVLVATLEHLDLQEAYWLRALGPDNMHPSMSLFS